jgi:hypothetical protein
VYEKLTELCDAAFVLCAQLKYHMRFEAQENSGQGILKIADEEGADLIIMGSRGLSSFKKTFVNSVSDYVLRNSKVPVLIVPARSCRDPALITKKNCSAARI